MTSSNGNIFRVTGHLCGEFTGPRWIPRTEASDAEVWGFFFNLLLNKRLSKQWWGWWFETPLHPLWRHCNASDDQIQIPSIYRSAPWRHQVEKFSALLVLCDENPSVTGGFPSQRPVTLSFDAVFWANNANVGDLRCHGAHYDVTVMFRYTSSHHTPFRNGFNSLWPSDVILSWPTWFE